MSRPDFAGRLADVVERSLGTPYDPGPLGEGPGGKYDADPIVDFSRVDCVTFVEQSLALAASKSRAEAVELLQRIRYKDGVIDYETRNHFMETDWFPNNPFAATRRVTSGGTVGVTRTISRKAFFAKVKAPELGQDTPDRKMTVAYVRARAPPRRKRNCRVRASSASWARWTGFSRHTAGSTFAARTARDSSTTLRCLGKRLCSPVAATTFSSIMVLAEIVGTEAQRHLPHLQPLSDP